MKPVRIWFSKTGAVRYISHLDLTRCMGRALKLSGLPVWYTQGFNPHIYMTFAMPLSLGTSGERECLDIRLNEDVDYIQAAKALNDCLPKDIIVLEMTEPELGFEAVAFGEYVMRLEGGAPSDLAAAIDRLLGQDKILVIKHGKKGGKEIDIKPYFENLEKSAADGILEIRAILPCSVDGSVNPGLLLEALKTYQGLDVYAGITRKRLLKKDFSDIR